MSTLDKVLLLILAGSIGYQAGSFSNVPEMGFMVFWILAFAVCLFECVVRALK